MQQASARLIQVTNWLATSVALLVTLALPLGYYQMAYRHQAGRVEAEADLQSYLISQVISRDPAFWWFEGVRINGFLVEQADGNYLELRRVLDEREVIVAQHPELASVSLPWPVLMRSAPLFDSGQVTGRVEILRSMRPMLVQACYVAAFATLLGGVVFTVMRVLPLRALKHAWQRIAYLASHDALTDLPNRVLLRDRLEQALARVRRQAEPAGVLCLDLDHFKDVNDTLGHAAGDRLLQQVAARLRACLRENDTLARLGGDEFAIIQGGLSQPEAAASLAQRVIEVLSHPFDLAGHETIIGSSVGIALCHAGDDPDGLLMNADLALYRAKEDGRGTYRFFEEAMNQRLRARKSLEQDLRRALAEDQFELYYQPQIELESQRIIGMEALLRWHHPERGTVPPIDFVPLAEETGLIVALGAWVLRTACAQAVPWQPLTMAVNLSPAQFRQPDLVGMVGKILHDTGLEGKYLELEITEGILLHDTEATIAILDSLKALGIRIAMDDFGTGYSSLGYLRRFPFDKIKIDRSFIHDMTEQTEAVAIVRAIIALGRALGMRATAEGVESLAQARLLRAEGCEEVQGFYFGRPAPAAELSRILRQETALSA